MRKFWLRGAFVIWWPALVMLVFVLLPLRAWAVEVITLIGEFPAQTKAAWRDSQ